MHASVPVLAAVFAGIVTAWPTNVNSTSVSASTWVSSNTPNSTETLTTYTTLTTCPVTITQGSGPSAIIGTTWTTSMTTITSCIGGCHHTASVSQPFGIGPTPPVQPLSTGILPSGSGISPPVITPPPITTTITSAVPSTTTITSVGLTISESTVTRFVPCSTPVATNGGSAYYSTFITPSYSTTLLTVPATIVQVICPVATSVGVAASNAAPPNGAGGYPLPVGSSPGSTNAAVSNNGAGQVTSVPAPINSPTTFYGPATGTCPPAQTIISTVVILSIPAPTQCSACSTHTFTLPNGSPITTIITPTPTPCAICETYTFTLPNGSPITTTITPSAAPTPCAVCKTSVYTLPNGIVTTTVIAPTTLNGGGSGTTVAPPVVTPPTYSNGTTVISSNGNIFPHGTGTGSNTPVVTPSATGGDVGLPPQVSGTSVTDPYASGITVIRPSGTGFVTRFPSGQGGDVGPPRKASSTSIADL